MGSVVKVKVRTPSGRLALHEKWKKANAAKCAICGKELQAIPRLRAAELRKLPKSKKRPERPFGGYLCSKCMREFFREKVRKFVL